MLGIRSLRGFTLIELMIAISLLSILLYLAVPAFGTYIQNAKLRAAAENFYAGVQVARAEAVRRNTLVQIMLTNSPPLDDANLSSIAPSASGTNWVVCTTDATAACLAFVEGKAASEGSAQAVQVNSGGVSAVTFNGFGRADAAATFAFSNPSGGDCAAASGPMRCLNVVVSIGGQGRMCDPAITAVGDTRAC